MTCLTQRAHTRGREADSIFVVLNLFRKSYDHVFCSKCSRYGLPFGVGDGWGGGAIFKLLRIMSHTGADFAISFSDPIIDIWTKRASMMLKYESIPPGSPSITARTFAPSASAPEICVAPV